jgi:phosphoribosylamine--glycine ligase/phosphoribosylformylglycinamidine cyclo-ligase
MSTSELYRTLNMGIGMVVVCGPTDADDVQAAIPETTWRIGRLVSGPRSVALS